MVDKFFREILEKCTEDRFLDVVRERNHYSVTDRESLRLVATAMKRCMQKEALWSLEVQADTVFAAAVMTLGAGVDSLQDSYLQKGLLSEAYMVEVLGSEILLAGYEALNRYVAEHTEYRVARYHFLQDVKAQKANIHQQEPDVSLRKLPGLLMDSGIPVTCNSAYCMTPRKSVAFYAEFTRDADTVCEGICVGCANQECPNRMQKQAGNAWNFADMIDRPLPYGYARIFGR